ncbi:MAG: TonB-dependent receptor [Sphingobacteriales bacterium]|nr:TonB-dependent receptor [Sphingobacteriales bacterium]
MKKRNIQVVAGLGLVQLVLLSTHLSAQTKDTTSLNEVVVTASRSPKKIADIGKVVKVISQEEIARSQGRTLPELLNAVVGLTVAGSGSNPGEVQSVYLRGASTANTLILIDGIAVNDASGISGEYNIAAIDISQIEKIEILKGASSTLYGSDAVAGVINIITKKGNQKLSAQALFTAGSYQTYKTAVGLNGNIKQTQVAFNFSNLDSKGFSTAQSTTPGASFDKDGFKQMAGGLNLSRFVTTHIKLTAGLQINQNRADLDNGAFADALNYTYDKVAFLAHLGTKISFNKGDLSLVFSQNNVKNKFDNYPSITNNKGNISNAEVIFNQQFTPFIGVTSGINYRYASTDQVYQDPNYPSQLNANNNIFSVYHSFFLKAGKLFRMELGGRYNHHSQYGDNLTYTVNPSILIANQFKFYVNVSSAYRVPSLYQLYSTYGNLLLKPETSENYETGIEGSILKDKITYTASVFKRDIRDVINFGLITTNKYGYINQNQQHDKGLELEIGLKPNKKLNFDVFYAYVDGNVRLSSTSPETFNLFRRPKNSVGANLGYAFSKSFLVSLNYRWNDKRIDQYYDVKTYSLVSTNLKAYSKLDAYFQYQFKKMRLFADIKNIFDTPYNDFAGYNAKGINFNAGISFTFN